MKTEIKTQDGVLRLLGRYKGTVDGILQLDCLTEETRYLLSVMLKRLEETEVNIPKPIAIPTDSQLQAMALEKFPEKMFDYLFGVHDENGEKREAYLQALRDLVKMMGGQDE